MQKHLFIAGALSAGLLACQASHANTACMVLGERTAKVSSAEGDRAPVFMTQACIKLRLLSGRAMASWIGKDGKPHLEPITPQGVAVLPQAGSEERSVSVVWEELSTRRERFQPALMRGSRVPPLYVPSGELVLLERTDAAKTLIVERVGGEAPFKVAEVAAVAGGRLLLDAALLAPEQTYAFRLTTDGEPAADIWMWRTLPAAQARLVRERVAQIADLPVEPAQRLLLQAMLFEQLNLRGNMDLIIQQSKAGGESGSNPQRE